MVEFHLAPSVLRSWYVHIVLEQIHYCSNTCAFHYEMSISSVRNTYEML